MVLLNRNAEVRATNLWSSINKGSHQPIGHHHVCYRQGRKGRNEEIKGDHGKEKRGKL